MIRNLGCSSRSKCVVNLSVLPKRSRRMKEKTRNRYGRWSNDYPEVNARVNRVKAEKPCKYKAIFKDSEQKVA
jgi:hypothetical protein